MNKIDVSISYGFGDDNRYYQENIPNSIQLALFKYDLYQQNKKNIHKALNQKHTNVNITHMPLDFLRHEPQLIFDMIKELRDEFGCSKFVVHPNKNIKEFLVNFLKENISDVILCVENFQWRKKKELRNPLKIIEYINILKEKYHHTDSRIRLCLDTSHTENLWFEYQLMYYLLPYTEIIHLSNRNGKKSHLPFNIGKGDLNLIGFVKDLKGRYNWRGSIVLEYMAEYNNKLKQNAEYVKKLLL